MSAEGEALKQISDLEKQLEELEKVLKLSDEISDGYCDLIEVLENANKALEKQLEDLKEEELLPYQFRDSDGNIGKDTDPYGVDMSGITRISFVKSKHQTD